MYMDKILVIVEAPGKVKKFQSILGSNYKVMASVGHIIDLDPKKMSIDIEGGFLPEYVNNADKVTVIKNIKAEAKKCKDVILATDDDREGEAIAWSLAYVLKLKNPKRIIFKSITKNEILNALKNPVNINADLVDAQKTRRMLDRLVGYDISPLLKGKLSAGRVQSVVVRLIIDKENEIKNHWDKIDNMEITSNYKIKSTFKSNKDIIKAILVKSNKEIKINDKETAKNIMEKCIKSTFKVIDVTKKEKQQNPSPPFTTSTLQQDASRKLGFSIKKTMTVAQKLYETGYITYMRTDSVSFSKEAISDIGALILKKFGEEYHHERNYVNKKNNTQEAHEAIRPTDVETLVPNGLSSDEDRLYKLIWKRAVASQMKAAKYDVTTILISISKLEEYNFLATVDVLIFDGYLAVYKDIDDCNNVKIKIKKGDIVLLETLEGNEEYPRGPTRYNEASLIEKLDPKNLNIGRPATYASIVTKIIDRGYVKIDDIPGKEIEIINLKLEDNEINENSSKIMLNDDKKKFIPTELGVNVNDFLVKEFPNIMDYKFTADMEEKLDEIAEGNIKYGKIMKEFYDEFKPVVETLKKEGRSYQKDLKIKLIGITENGDEIVYCVTKNGPAVSKKVNKKLVYSSLPEGKTIDNITLEEASALLSYPKILGKYNKKNVIIKNGPYGYYMVWGLVKLQLSDPNITLEDAIELLSKEKCIAFKTEYRTMVVKKGYYGYYIQVTPKTKGSKSYNVPIPKDTDIDSLTCEKLEEIIKEKFQNKKTNYKKKKVKTQ